MSNVGVAVVGAASWGKNVVKAFAGASGASLRGVCDLRPELLARVATAHPGVRLTRSFDDLLRDPEITAVALAVDAGSHHRLARRALETGRHVFVEKPLALTVADSEELCLVAERNRRTLMVGHLLLYHPGILVAKRALDAGELGEARYLHAQRVNRGVVRTNENAWWSLAPHDIAVAMFLLDGAPSTVSATGACFLHGAGAGAGPRGGPIEDVAFATLRWSDGRVAHIHVSWIDAQKRRSLTIVGSQGSLTVDGTAPVSREQEPLRVECDHFIECIRTGSRPRSDGAQGLAVVRVLEAGERSMRTGGAPIAIGA
jgi:predicted dehydrogenase